LFTRKDKLTSCYDARIIKAKEFIDHLKTWKGNTKTAKEFISDKLWFDLQAMVIGLEQVVKIKSRAFPDTGIIKPVIINQDVIENIFCQVRGSNGQNNNPTYLSYGSTITSVTALLIHTCRLGSNFRSFRVGFRGCQSCVSMATYVNFPPVSLSKSSVSKFEVFGCILKGGFHDVRKFSERIRRRGKH